MKSTRGRKEEWKEKRKEEKKEKEKKGRKQERIHIIIDYVFGWWRGPKREP